MRVNLKGNELRLVIPKVPELVSGARRIPGARWQKLEREWSIPMTSLNEVRGFAIEHGLEMDPELEVMDIPKRRPRPGLEVRGDLLGMSVPHDRVRWAEAKKLIPGILFDIKASEWSAPKTSLKGAVEWCDKFRYDVPEPLRAVIALQQERVDRLACLSEALSGPPLDVPGLCGTLMPHQHAGVLYASKTRRCFIADDMGVGKTLTAIAALEYMHSEEEPSYPALIISPPKLTANWQKEYERWLPGRTVQVIRTKAESPEGADVTIIGHAIIFAKKDELIGFRSLVLDESHAFKTPTSQRTKAARQIAQGKKVKKQVVGGVPGPILCLTGTPITIRPAEYVPQLDIMGRLKDFGASDMGFYKTYCGAFQDKRNQWNWKGAERLPELNKLLRGTCYVRRERMDVLDDLPPNFPRDVEVEMESRWRKEYDEAEADIVNYLVERAKEIARELGEDVRSAAVLARMKAEAGKHLVKIGVLREIAAMGKIGAAKEWTETAVEADKRVMIGAHHRKVVDALAEHFGGLKIQGGMTTRAVEEAKTQFQTGAPVIVVSIQAGGEGHTLTAATDALIMEFPWASTQFDQLVGRIWRKGQKNVTFTTSMLAADTMDIQHFDLLAQRRRNVSLATTGEKETAPELVSTFLAKGLANL